MRSIFKTAIFLLPAALISTYLLTSPKRTPVPSDLRDAVAADQLSAEAGPQAQAVPDRPILPAHDSAAEKSISSLSKDHCKMNPMAPGCPMYCRHHHAYPGCPMYCQLNPMSPACKKSVEKGLSEDKSAADLAKANCAAYPNAPGCPMYCKDHHAYPGCPMYCQLNPMSPACKGNKEAEAALKSLLEDEAAEGLAKANCAAYPASPGCPLFCHHHHGYPGCMKYIQTSPALKEVSDKSVAASEKDLSSFIVKPTAAEENENAAGLAKANCAAYPNAPGCPMYCKDHHAYPGCPMYCQLNPMSPACRK